MKSVLLVEELQTFRADWVRDEQLPPAALVWSQAGDDSMESVIHKGDYYVVDTSSKDVIDGRTYSVWYSGAERARRLFKLPGNGLKIVAENEDFPTIDLTAEQALSLHIIGRIVHRSGKGGL